MKKLPAILLLALPALVQDAQAEYKSKLGTLNKSLAAAHVVIADFLTAQTMHGWARDEFNKAMALDPENEKARAKLGYKKTDSGWEFDASAPQEFNNKKSGSDMEKVRRDYESKATSMGKDSAVKLLDLAQWCEKSGLKEEAVENYKKAVEYDPTNEKARKALGYEKQKIGGWLSKFEKETRKEMKEGLTKAPKGSPSSAQTDAEKALSLTMTKQESEHFLFSSPHLAKGTLETLVRHAEHAYAMWHKIFNQKDLLGGKKITFVILKDKDQHIKFVDAFNQGNAAQKDLAKKSDGSIGLVSEMFQGDKPQPTLEDWVVHAVAQILQGGFAIGQPSANHNPIWVEEGLAYYFTKVMKDTALSG